jgi:CHAT domain-containing protein
MLGGRESVSCLILVEPLGRDDNVAVPSGLAVALAFFVQRSGPPGDLLLGLDASEQELVRLAESNQLSGFDCVHLATHAVVDDERPERSSVVLCQVGLPDPLEAALDGTRIYDGFLTAEEIVREWKLDADLVTLSACETGLGRRVAGEGYIGFAHAFLQVGARSLMVGLWKVDDEATSLLMRRFYENWTGSYAGARAGQTGEPMTKANALREAKMWLRQYEDDRGGTPFRHPYYWAAFVLIGDRQ